MSVRRIAPRRVLLLHATFFFAAGCLPLVNVTAQQVEQIDHHLQYGEFSKAIELAQNLPTSQSDRQLSRIAALQHRSGSIAAAQKTVSRIDNDTVRFKALLQQGLPSSGDRRGESVESGSDSNSGIGNGDLPTGLAGGVTEADFQPLIRLIKSTVDPDNWDDANGDGTILAYPAGVYVDSTGTLQKIKIDRNRNLRRLAMRSKQRLSGNRLVDQSAKLRKVSLIRLEKQAQLLAAAGKPVDESMQHVAGIYSIEYLMLLPESNDIVIAGPAGAWQLDSDGHAVNVETGKPVLRLDDLAVCLRNAQPQPLGNAGKFGCSITPRKENLAETKSFLASSPLTGKAWRDELRDTLGLQDIEVFGIDPATHAGRTLVEADYRMKLVAMGLEPSIAEIPSYLDRLRVGQTDSMDVVRWWFTMNYDQILTDQDNRVFSFSGSGVKVLSENEFINEQGDRIHTGQSDRPTAGFARDFTDHYDQISRRYPIYHRLANLFDLAIVSALIRSYQLDHQANWNLTFFGNDPAYEEFTYQPSTEPVALQVESVINHRVVRQRKQNSTLKHTLVGVSGGITFDAMRVLREKMQVDHDQMLTEMAIEPGEDQSESEWWWD